MSGWTTEAYVSREKSLKENFRHTMMGRPEEDKAQDPNCTIYNRNDAEENAYVPPSTPQSPNSDS